MKLWKLLEDIRFSTGWITRYFRVSEDDIDMILAALSVSAVFIFLYKLPNMIEAFFRAQFSIAVIANYNLGLVFGYVLFMAKIYFLRRRG